MKDMVYSLPKDAIGVTLLEEMGKNEKIVVLSSDVSISANIEMVNEKYPRRFFEMGIAEQSTMSVSGGLAIEGFIPVYVALSIFSCEMTFAQMRQVCNANLNVKIVGTHPGVDDGEDGSGHHANEDMALTRSLPRMTVLCPSDSNEVAAALRTALTIDGPVYIRAARAALPEVHAPSCTFPLSRAEYMEDEGEDFAIVYEGSALIQAYEGWERLKEAGYKGKLVSLRTVKPIDKECIESLAAQVNTIITVENHSIIGGVYSAVSEAVAGTRHKAVIVPVGFRDEFTESGKESDIKNKYGLSSDKIYEEFLKTL